MQLVGKHHLNLLPLPRMKGLRSRHNLLLLPRIKELLEHRVNLLLLPRIKGLPLLNKKIRHTLIKSGNIYTVTSLSSITGRTSTLFFCKKRQNRRYNQSYKEERVKR